MNVVFTQAHLLLSLIASLFRLGAGKAAAPVTLKTPLILYEFEGCPFCRIAREAFSESGLPVLVRPCPRLGDRFRPQVKELGGKMQFPYLIDPNTDIRMYESRDIATYLAKTYTYQPRPWIHYLWGINMYLSQLATLIRLTAGTFKRSAIENSTPLQLIGTERNPGTRLVKELLCELQLEYIWQSASHDRVFPPYLHDPDTQTSLQGARAIRNYLKKTYAKR